MSSIEGLDLDLSQVEGRSYRCLEGCELCCLCQPEVMPDEAKVFREHYPDKLVSVDDDHQHLALAMREGGGPCSFLKEGRCEIYDHRPRFCRQFPLHLYLGERVQAEIDLSCRGVWLGGETGLERRACEVVQENLGELEDLLGKTRRFYVDFQERCRAAGVYHDPEEMKEGVGSLIQRMDLGSLARTLESSADDLEMSFPITAGRPLGAREIEELEAAVRESALSSLESDSPYQAPVYCDPRGRWHIFEVASSTIHWQMMDREGGLESIAFVDPNDVSIADTTLINTSLFREYMGVLARRDSFWGQAYYLEDVYGYGDYLSNTCFGTFANAALDLLWRTRLLGRIFQMREGEELMREGIIFYDMDRLGAPMIGAFF